MHKDKVIDIEWKSDRSESDNDIIEEKNYMSTKGTKIIDEEEDEKVNF